MAFTITTRTDGNALVFVPNGPIDTEGSQHLSETVAQALPPGEPKLVFDMGKVPWITSAALGIFARLMKEHPGRVVLAAPQDYVADTVRLNRLDTRCTICKTVEEAINP